MLGSAMCMEPPLPRHSPVSRPNNSANMASTFAPLAMR